MYACRFHSHFVIWWLMLYAKFCMMMTMDFIEHYGFSLSKLRKIDFHYVAAPFFRPMNNFDVQSEYGQKNFFFFSFRETENLM